MQRFECLSDRIVVDVADAVQEEHVGSQFGSGGPGFDTGQVDVAYPELGQRGHQCTWHIVDPQHHRRPIGTGTRGRWSRRTHQNKAGARVVFIDHAVCQRRQPALGAGQRRTHRGVDVAVGDLLRGVGVGVRGAQLGGGQMGGQPAPHLGRGDREGGQRAHVGGRATRLHDNAERHVQRQLGEHLQRRSDRQTVQGRHDRTVDRVLDRHAGVLGHAVTNRIKSSGRAVDRHRRHGSRVVLRNHAGLDHLPQRRFGERPLGTQIRDPRHDQNPIGGYVLRRSIIPS